jgi:NAD-dependent dihydropyrimidine dehydrogenase PreA subunit
MQAAEFFANFRTRAEAIPLKGAEDEGRREACLPAGITQAKKGLGHAPRPAVFGVGARISRLLPFGHPGQRSAAGPQPTLLKGSRGVWAPLASDASPLSADELTRINASMDENRKLAELYCTGCNYCMPCPQGVNIPLNFQVMNYHKVYGITEYAKGQYAAIGTNDWMKGKQASECIECGLCEEKCPQKIEIRKQLKETAAALGK